MGYWIALGIVVITIIAFIIAVMRMEKKVSNSLSNMKELEDNLKNSSAYLDTNITYLKEKALVQKDYANDMYARASVGLDNLTVLEDESKVLQDHIAHLNAHKDEYGRAIFETGKDYVQAEAPRRWNRFKAISKRTIDKQKSRYSKGEI